MIHISSDLGDGTLPDRAWPEVRALLERYAATPIAALRPRGTTSAHKRLAMTDAGDPVLLCAPEARGLNWGALTLVERDDLVTCPLCLAVLKGSKP